MVSGIEPEGAAPMYQLINLLTATINKHLCERRIKNDQATFLYFFNAPVPNNYHVITSRSLSESDKLLDEYGMLESNQPPVIYKITTLTAELIPPYLFCLT